MIQYVRFDPPRRLEEYTSHPSMPLAGYDALADAKVRGGPAQYAVQGEWHHDGKVWLDLAVTRPWLEHRTNYRADDRGVLRWTCPVCGRVGGKHEKLCEYES